MRRPEAEETIAAVSTPLGEGGIGIVRLSGPEARAIAGAVFVAGDGGRVTEYATHTVHYGHVRDPKGPAGVSVDEVLLVVMRAPRSYTREDIVEIHCHGGPLAVKSVLELAVEHGARVAEPGEFTKRAFLNGRIDLAQAEAVLDLIRAKTDASSRAAMGQLEGLFSGRIDAMIDALTGLAGHVEAAIDFPDEDLSLMSEADCAGTLGRIITGMKDLLETAAYGMVLREGLLVTICGKPNVGKSSLMNLLLKKERVIVTPAPGTTRDAVEETVNLKGFPVRLADTAGIFEATHVADREAAARSRDYIGRADAVIFVIDGSGPIEAEDRAIREAAKGKKMLVVVNKADLPRVTGEADVRDLCGDVPAVTISLSRRMNIEAMESALAKLLFQGKVFQGEGAVVTHARHKALLERALSHAEAAAGSLAKGLPADLVAEDLKAAITALGLITGRSVFGDILERIFSEFCVGK